MLCPKERAMVRDFFAAFKSSEWHMLSDTLVQGVYML